MEALWFLLLYARLVFDVVHIDHIGEIAIVIQVELGGFQQHIVFFSVQSVVEAVISFHVGLELVAMEDNSRSGLNVFGLSLHIGVRNVVTIESEFAVPIEVDCA